MSSRPNWQTDRLVVDNRLCHSQNKLKQCHSIYAWNRFLCFSVLLFVENMVGQLGHLYFAPLWTAACRNSPWRVPKTLEQSVHLCASSWIFMCLFSASWFGNVWVHIMHIEVPHLLVWYLQSFWRLNLPPHLLQSYRSSSTLRRPISMFSRRNWALSFQS